MATYVLIAGAWHGSWCWSEIVPLLKAAGHQVLTPDLLGMTVGEQTVMEEPVLQWADQIAEVVRAQDDPVILVGHSRAGIVISEVAERVPDRVKLLVYLCAFLLKDGETLNGISQQAANFDAVSDAVDFREDGTSVVKPDKIASMLYNDTADRFVQIARERLVAEPIASFMTPVHLTEERFGSVARAYIECTDDHMIPIADQCAMQRTVGITLNHRLDSDHSPFFSRPRELVLALESMRQKS